jgi:hypothetical protein
VKAPLGLLALTLCASPALAQAVTYVEPSEETYVQVIVATTGWAKSQFGKSLGVLAPSDGSESLLHAIEAAAKQHGLKQITLNDYTVRCIRHPASRSAPAFQSCSMRGADAVLQFAEVRVVGDSGSVVTSVTRVPKGEMLPKTERFCVLLAKKTADWDAYRGDTMSETDQCPRE